MKTCVETIETVAKRFALSDPGLRAQTCPQGLQTVWMSLAERGQLRDLAEALQAVGCRLGTVTVYRLDAGPQPDRHEVAYHFLLDGLPITVQVIAARGEAIPSISGLYPNADWEERELMELCDVPVEGHPNPRRLFLDESIEAGVFDRYVPFSELTNLANADAVWARIREDSRKRAETQETAS